MASDEASEERSQEKVDAAAAEGDDAKEAPVPERVRVPRPGGCRHRCSVPSVLGCVVVSFRVHFPAQRDGRACTAA